MAKHVRSEVFVQGRAKERSKRQRAGVLECAGSAALWISAGPAEEASVEGRASSAFIPLTRLIIAWFAKNARDLPWRRTRDPYAIWISEVMLQQTQVKTVIPAWERWMQHLPTIRSLARADEQRVLKLWEGLGYYTRARNLRKAARLLCAQNNGAFPGHFDDILALPGIGRYTAGAICSIAYGQPAPILDGNVIRVLSRIFALDGNPKSKSNQDLLWLFSAGLVTAAAKHNRCSSLNQGLMELGATLCLPTRPLCVRCPARAYCQAFRTGRVDEFPQLPPRAATRQRRFLAYILRHGDKVLVRQRPASIVNGSLWEFPNIELVRGKQNNLTALDALKLRPFGVIKHTIMNDRITLRALTTSVNGAARSVAAEFSAEWRPLVDLDALPFTGAHAKLRILLMAATEV
jgi:A/G-specific adenine glycosylase